MGKGTLRNKVCSCGSGKKFKNCHEKKESQEKIKLYEIENDMRETYSHQTCMVADELKCDCTKKIIKAHTVSKSSNLKQIAENGHVYGFKKSIMALDSNDGKFPVEKIGINKASVFNGFCSKHDKELFAIIEDKEIVFSNEQIFILAYRAISRELYLKYRSTENNQNMFDYDKGVKNVLLQKMFHDMVKQFSEGINLAVRDLEIIKNNYDNSLINQDYENIKYYIIIIDSIPEVMSSGCWIPEVTFNGEKLVDFNDKNKQFNSITVSTIALKENAGAIVFSWDDRIPCPECFQFLKSLNEIPDNNKGNAILKWMLECNENIYFSPKWWDSLDKKIQELLVDDMSNIMKLQLDLTNYHKYEGCVNWKILEIKTNLVL
ncbi:MAG: SEC-C domain-containing protein [Sulfuricurvum sp.]|uniref:SEC-C metal-binding domain-containing protein n=1 Tax=Sulfuricurvum sp. TaxID=2025608 RepID=UPI0025EF27B7|nr:SEC-C metal-binding domain-containing protein [Sulfuricurvum sp.]MBV5321913.1 SEC-C domain-containing protein [Sulfuricurvum sp.]